MSSNIILYFGTDIYIFDMHIATNDIGHSKSYSQFIQSHSSREEGFFDPVYETNVTTFNSLNDNFFGRGRGRK